MRYLIIPTTVLALASLATSQSPNLTANAKVIYNPQKTNWTARNSANTERHWYMQPVEARRGYGKFRGWVAALTDFDSTTAETVEFGVSRYVQGKMEPDISNRGTVFFTRANLSFQDPKNPKLKRRDLLWTITLQSAQPTPESLGLFVGLGTARFSGQTPTDGVFIHTQSASTTKLPVALRKNWTWYRDSTMAKVAANGLGKGTTLHLGAFYDEPVLRQFVRSTRYQNKPEDLYGLEAYWPDSAAKDAIGWDVESDQFKNGLAVTTLGAALLTKPITIQFGTLWMSPPFGIIQAPAVLLSAKGSHRTPTPVPAIKGIKLYNQTAFINPKTFQIRMSDLTEINMQ